MNVADDDDNDGKDLPMNIPAVKSLEKSRHIRLFPRSLFFNKFKNSGLKSVYITKLWNYKPFFSNDISGINIIYVN